MRGVIEAVQQELDRERAQHAATRERVFDFIGRLSEVKGALMFHDTYGGDPLGVVEATRRAVHDL